MTTTTNMPDGAIARKVGGSVLGGGAGVIIADVILWLLDDYLFDPDTAGSVPTPLASFVLFAVTVGLTFAGGYFTKRGIEETIVLPDEALAALPLGERIKAEAAQRVEDAETQRHVAELAAQPGVVMFVDDGEHGFEIDPAAYGDQDDDDELEGHGDEMGEDDEVVDGPEDDPDPIDPDAR